MEVFGGLEAGMKRTMRKKYIQNKEKEQITVELIFLKKARSRNYFLEVGLTKEKI